MTTLFCSRVRETAKAAIVASLCLTMAGTQAFAADVPASRKSSPLTKQERTLHALNRLTFGPRPGDEAVVSKMGLEAWFNRQLHPETIDDSAFEKRLDEFPALQLSQTEMIRQFPSPLLVRFLLGGNVHPPTFFDPVNNAIYADYIARYKFGLALQANGMKGGGDATAADLKIADAARETGQMGPGMAMSPGASASTSQAVAASQNVAMVDSMSISSSPIISPAPKIGMGYGASRKEARESGLVTAAKEKLPPATITPLQMQEIVALPPQARFDRIVAMTPSDNMRFIVVMAPRLQEVMAGFTPRQKEAVGAMINPIRVIGTETLEARLLRDIYSERQLQAVMNDFWLNHFSVYVKKSAYEPYLLNSYDKDAILPNAMGNFEQLLIATAKSPAMLMYLDNWESVGPDSPFAQRAERLKKARPDAPLAKLASAGINENYARELMELHTVGVNGGYTQKDVIEVAKCFTGWTIDRPYGGVVGSGDIQTFRFDPTKHAGGAKVVMGVTIPEGGMQEGLTVLHMLATSPKTAHFISEKLAVRFVSDAPPQSLVDAMAATFLKTNGSIPAVLSTMFHSPEFWAPSVYRAKVKTPIEFLASALRASNANVTNAALLVQAAERLGMPIYGMQTPNGYSWKSEDWVSSGALVNRMNFALVLSGDHVRGAKTDWAKLVGQSTDPAAPSAETEKSLEYLILGEQASVKTRSTVLDQFKNSAVQDEAQKNFSLQEAANDEENGGGAMQGQGPGGRRAGLREKGAAMKNYQGGLSLDSKPGTPLDTMAGLLLGSPDFQRR